MSSLPEEIYLDILLRIPVRSTLVCKCVCKSWFQLISDPDFVKMHLTTQTNNSSLLVKSDNNNGYLLYSSYDSLSSSLTESDNDDVVELEIPYKYLRYRSTKLLGSCNGLVYGWNRLLNSYFLWNPATKEYKRLPKLDAYYYYHGFGYDYKTDDYKLVVTHKLVVTRKNEKSYVVQVYSLKSNSWKSLQSIQFDFHLPQISGVFFSKALHWLTGGKKLSSIVSMDITEERFENLQLPIILPTQYYINIAVLEERLCVLAKAEYTFDIWVMQHYGVRESWTKFYTITFESIMDGYLYPVLIGSFKNGEILFRERKNIISYDKYGTARKTDIDFIHEEGAVKYSESLVSLNSNTVVGVGRRKQGQSTTKKRNRSLQA